MPRLRQAYEVGSLLSMLWAGDAVLNPPRGYPVFEELTRERQ